jgi:hypothetical protein
MDDYFERWLNVIDIAAKNTVTDGIQIVSMPGGSPKLGQKRVIEVGGLLPLRVFPLVMESKGFSFV